MNSCEKSLHEVTSWLGETPGDDARNFLTRVLFKEETSSKNHTPDTRTLPRYRAHGTPGANAVLFAKGVLLGTSGPDLCVLIFFIPWLYLPLACGERAQSGPLRSSLTSGVTDTVSH